MMVLCCPFNERLVYCCKYFFILFYYLKLTPFPLDDQYSCYAYQQPSCTHEEEHHIPLRCSLGSCRCGVFCPVLLGHHVEEPLQPYHSYHELQHWRGRVGLLSLWSVQAAFKHESWLPWVWKMAEGWNSLDLSCMCSRNSLHIICDQLFMVIFNTLATFPMEVEFVQNVMGRVGRDILLKCDRRRRQDVPLASFLVLMMFRSYFEIFNFTKEEDVQVASLDARTTGGKNPVSGAKSKWSDTYLNFDTGSAETKSWASMSLVERIPLAVQKEQVKWYILNFRHWECGDSGDHKGGKGQQTEKTHVWETTNEFLWLDGASLSTATSTEDESELGWEFIFWMIPSYNENDSLRILLVWRVLGPGPLLGSTNPLLRSRNMWGASSYCFWAYIKDQGKQFHRAITLIIPESWSFSKCYLKQ